MEGTPIGVYSTLEKAEEAKRAYSERVDYIEIYEAELDAEPKKLYSVKESVN